MKNVTKSFGILALLVITFMAACDTSTDENGGEPGAASLPATPRDVSVSIVGGRYPRIMWAYSVLLYPSANLPYGWVTFTVMRSTSASGPFDRVEDGAGAVFTSGPYVGRVRFYDFSPPRGTTLFYVVYAHNINGTSPRSSVVSIIAPP